MTEPYYQDAGVRVFHGDCLDVLRSLPDASVHAVVTDPPYGISFMGKQWDQPGAQNHKGGTGGRGFADGPLGKDHTKTRERSASMHAGEYDLSPSAMLSFQLWCTEWAAECLRVLKPGGHMLAFGGSRTWHRLACAVEDAGFEIRDSIAWLYGSGFPKSLDVSKAIEQRERGSLVRAKLLHFAETRGIDGRWLESRGVASSASFADWTTGGHVPSEANWQIVKAALDVTADEEAAFEREVLSASKGRRGDGTVYALGHSGRRVGGAVLGSAQEWEGWGTALKPAFEPIVVARKPLMGTVAANVLAHGTGALNIDANRIHTEGSEGVAYTVKRLKPGATLEKTGGAWRSKDGEEQPWEAGREYEGQTKDGRWPSNVVLDESQAAELDEQTGVLTSGIMRAGAQRAPSGGVIYGKTGGYTTSADTYGDSGGASRFFPTFRYEAKAPTSERPEQGGVVHPTVKPLELMRWLVRLVASPGATVLDPFAGSGTTLEACLLEGFDVVGIEREESYLPLIMQRIRRPLQQSLFDVEVRSSGWSSVEPLQFGEAL